MSAGGLDPFDTIDDCINWANDHGWLVGSLAQLGPQDWYTCMIDDAGYAHTGTGTTPVLAMTFAMQQPPMGRVWSKVEGVLTDANDERIDLAALGLIKKKPAVSIRR